MRGRLPLLTLENLTVQGRSRGLGYSLRPAPSPLYPLRIHTLMKTIPKPCLLVRELSEDDLDEEVSA